MKRLLQPFVLVVTALLAAAYAYPAARLATGPWERVALAIPFFLIWIVPALYWTAERDGEESWLDQAAHQASYLSMAWVSFILVLTLIRDLLLFATAALPLERAHGVITEAGVPAVSILSLAAVALGAIVALRGPGVEEVEIRVPGLHPELHGFRIVQISDLHVGRSIRRGYVERTVERARSLAPDLVALTGTWSTGRSSGSGRTSRRSRGSRKAGVPSSCLAITTVIPGQTRGSRTGGEWAGAGSGERPGGEEGRARGG